MDKFTRRDELAGGAVIARLERPTLIGHKSAVVGADGVLSFAGARLERVDVALYNAIDGVVETFSVVIPDTTSATEIVMALRAGLIGADPHVRVSDGRLVIEVLNPRYTSITVLPTSTAATGLGLNTFPHPRSTSHVGDYATMPTGLGAEDGIGAYIVPFEDRTSSSINRAVDAVARNTVELETRARTPEVDLAAAACDLVLVPATKPEQLSLGLVGTDTATFFQRVAQDVCIQPDYGSLRASSVEESEYFQNHAPLLSLLQAEFKADVDVCSAALTLIDESPRSMYRAKTRLVYGAVDGDGRNLIDEDFTVHGASDTGDVCVLRIGSPGPQFLLTRVDSYAHIGGAGYFATDLAGTAYGPAVLVAGQAVNNAHVVTPHTLRLSTSSEAFAEYDLLHDIAELGELVVLTEHGVFQATHVRQDKTIDVLPWAGDLNDFFLVPHTQTPIMGRSQQMRVGDTRVALLVGRFVPSTARLRPMIHHARLVLPSARLIVKEARRPHKTAGAVAYERVVDWSIRSLRAAVGTVTLPPTSLSKIAAHPSFTSFEQFERGDGIRSAIGLLPSFVQRPTALNVGTGRVARAKELLDLQAPGSVLQNFLESGSAPPEPYLSAIKLVVSRAPSNLYSSDTLYHPDMYDAPAPAELREYYEQILEICPFSPTVSATLIGRGPSTVQLQTATSVVHARDIGRDFIFVLSGVPKSLRLLAVEGSVCTLLSYEPLPAPSSSMSGLLVPMLGFRTGAISALSALRQSAHWGWTSPSVAVTELRVFTPHAQNTSLIRQLGASVHAGNISTITRISETDNARVTTVAAPLILPDYVAQLTRGGVELAIHTQGVIPENVWDLPSLTNALVSDAVSIDKLITLLAATGATGTIKLRTLRALLGIASVAAPVLPTMSPAVQTAVLADPLVTTRATASVAQYASDALSTRPYRVTYSTKRVVSVQSIDAIRAALQSSTPYTPLLKSLLAAGATVQVGDLTLTDSSVDDEIAELFEFEDDDVVSISVPQVGAGLLLHMQSLRNPFMAPGGTGGVGADAAVTSNVYNVLPSGHINALSNSAQLSDTPDSPTAAIALPYVVALAYRDGEYRTPQAQTYWTKIYQLFDFDDGLVSPTPVQCFVDHDTNLVIFNTADSGYLGYNPQSDEIESVDGKGLRAIAYAENVDMITTAGGSTPALLLKLVPIDAGALLDPPINPLTVTFLGALSGSDAEVYAACRTLSAATVGRTSLQIVEHLAQDRLDTSILSERRHSAVVLSGKGATRGRAESRELVPLTAEPGQFVSSMHYGNRGAGASAALEVSVTSRRKLESSAALHVSTLNAGVTDGTEISSYAGSTQRASSRARFVETHSAGAVFTGAGPQIVVGLNSSDLYDAWRGRALMGALNALGTDTNAAAWLAAGRITDTIRTATGTGTALGSGARLASYISGVVSVDGVLALTASGVGSRGWRHNVGYGNKISGVQGHINPIVAPRALNLLPATTAHILHQTTIGEAEDDAASRFTNEARAADRTSLTLNNATTDTLLSDQTALSQWLPNHIPQLGERVVILKREDTLYAHTDIVVGVPSDLNVSALRYAGPFTGLLRIGYTVSGTSDRLYLYYAEPYFDYAESMIGRSVVLDIEVSVEGGGNVIVGPGASPSDRVVTATLNLSGVVENISRVSMLEHTAVQVTLVAHPKATLASVVTKNAFFAQSTSLLSFVQSGGATNHPLYVAGFRLSGGNQLSSTQPPSLSAQVNAVLHVHGREWLLNAFRATISDRVDIVNDRGVRNGSIRTTDVGVTIDSSSRVDINAPQVRINGTEFSSTQSQLFSILVSVPPPITGTDDFLNNPELVQYYGPDLLSPDRDRPIDSFAAKLSPRVRIGYATSAASVTSTVRCRSTLTEQEEVVYPFLVNVPLTLDETYTPDIVHLTVRAALHIETLIFINNKFTRVTLRGIGRGRTQLGDEAFPFTADANNPAGVLPAAGSIVFVPMFFDMVMSCVIAGEAPEGQMYADDINLSTTVRDVFVALEQLTPGSDPFAHLTMGIVDAPQGLRLYPMRRTQAQVPAGWADDPEGVPETDPAYSIAARTYLEYQVSDSPIYNYLPSTTALSVYSSFDSIPDWVYGGQGIETYRCGRIPQSFLGDDAPSYATSCRTLGSRVFGRWSITRNSCGHNNGYAITNGDQGDFNDWRGYEDMTYTSYAAITDKFRFSDTLILETPDVAPGSLALFEDRTITYRGDRDTMGLDGAEHPTGTHCGKQLYTPSIAVHLSERPANEFNGALITVIKCGTAPNDPTPRRPLIRWNLPQRVDRNVYCVRRYDTALTTSDLGITRPYPDLYRGRFIEEAEQDQSDVFAFDRRAYAYANLLHDVELTGGLVASNLHTPTDVADMTTLAETIADTIEQHVFYLQASRPIADLTAHDALFDPAALPMVQDRYAASAENTALLSDARVIPDALGRGLLAAQVLPAAQQSVGVGGIALDVDYTDDGPSVPTTRIAFLVRVDRAALAKKLEDSQLTLRTQAVLSTCLRYTVI
jgi:hypothetical protein